MLGVEVTKIPISMGFRVSEDFHVSRRAPRL